MLNSLDDIIGDNLVDHFEEIANSYGLHGTYLKYFTSASSDEEIYFVCALDKKVLSDDSINVEKISLSGDRQYLNINPHIAAFKITGNKSLLTHQKVVDYCQTVEFLSKLYAEHKMALPQAIPIGIIDGLKMQHSNATNPALPQETRDSYKSDIRATLEKQDAFFTDHGNDSEKAAFYLYQQYDSQKSKIANWLKRVFSEDKNRVSLDHLVTTCKEITTIGVHISDAQAVQEELRKHPEIIYWMSDKPVGQKLECPDNQGYGSRKANDRRYIPFSFDSKYSTDFVAIVNKIGHPDGYKTNVKELISEYPYAEHLTIPSSEYHKYTSAFKSNGIRFCIKDTATNTDVINMVVACHTNKIDEIVSSVATKNETEHLYTDINERQATAREDFLNTKRSELEESMLQRAEEFLGSSNIELISVSGDLLSDEPADMSDDLSF